MRHSYLANGQMALKFWTKSNVICCTCYCVSMSACQRSNNDYALFSQTQNHKQTHTHAHTHTYANTTKLQCRLSALVALLTSSAPCVNMRLRSLKLNTRHSKRFQLPTRWQADRCRRVSQPAHRPLRPWRFGCNANSAFAWTMTPKEKTEMHEHFYPIESVAMTRGIHVKHLPAKNGTVIESRLRAVVCKSSTNEA